MLEIFLNFLGPVNINLNLERAFTQIDKLTDFFKFVFFVIKECVFDNDLVTDLDQFCKLLFNVLGQYSKRNFIQLFLNYFSAVDQVQNDCAVFPAVEAETNHFPIIFGHLKALD